METKMSESTSITSADVGELPASVVVEAPAPLPPPKKFYSPSTRGFYSSEINDAMPVDAVEITVDEWHALREAESTGKIIRPGPNGKPFADEKNAQEKSVALICERDNLLAGTDWLVNRHRDEVEATGATTLAPDKYRALQTWRMALRNLTAMSGFPNVSIPARPDGV